MHQAGIAETRHAVRRRVARSALMALMALIGLMALVSLAQSPAKNPGADRFAYLDERDPYLVVCGCPLLALERGQLLGCC